MTKSLELCSMYNVIQGESNFVHFDEDRTILKNVPSKISAPLIIDVLVAYLPDFLL